MESMLSNLLTIQVDTSTSKADNERVKKVYAEIDKLMKHTKQHDNKQV